MRKITWLLLAILIVSPSAWAATETGKKGNAYNNLTGSLISSDDEWLLWDTSAANFKNVLSSELLNYLDRNYQGVNGRPLATAYRQWVASPVSGDQSSIALVGGVAWCVNQIGANNALLILPAGTYSFPSDYTIPSNVCILPMPGCRIAPASGVDVVIGKLSGTPGPFQWIDISGGGTVAFAEGAASEVWVDWFGVEPGAGVVQAALDSLPDIGGAVRCSARTLTFCSGVSLPIGDIDLEWRGTVIQSGADDIDIIKFSKGSGNANRQKMHGNLEIRGNGHTGVTAILDDGGWQERISGVRVLDVENGIIIRQSGIGDYVDNVHLADIKLKSCATGIAYEVTTSDGLTSVFATHRLENIAIVDCQVGIYISERAKLVQPYMDVHVWGSDGSIGLRLEGQLREATGHLVIEPNGSGYAMTGILLGAATYCRLNNNSMRFSMPSFDGVSRVWISNPYNIPYSFNFFDNASEGEIIWADSGSSGAIAPLRIFNDSGMEVLSLNLAATGIPNIGAARLGLWDYAAGAGGRLDVGAMYSSGDIFLSSTGKNLYLGDGSPGSWRFRVDPSTNILHLQVNAAGTWTDKATWTP